MRKTAAFVFGAFGVLLTLAAVPQARQSAGLSAADLDTFNASFAAAWAKGDGAAVAAHYTQDAVRIGTGQETQTGRAAVQKYFAETLAGPSKGSKITLRTLGTRPVASDVTVVYGTFEVTGTGARTGRFMNTVVRRDGTWQVATSAAVVDQPPAK